MPIEYCIKYQGQCYDVGTRLKFYRSGIMWTDPIAGTVEKFVNSYVFIKGDDGHLYEFSIIRQESFEKIIVEIIEPVYYQEPAKVTKHKEAVPPEEDIFIGWVWYIIIMLVGVIFKDRLSIWITATVIFFLWKNGKI